MTTTERITSATSADGRYECLLDDGWFKQPQWLVLDGEFNSGWRGSTVKEMCPFMQPDAPGLDAQIVLDRFLDTLTRCGICNEPSDDLKGYWDGPSGAEVWVDICRACRGEE